MFDQICHEHGIRHLLTAPYSPTTTGKVERHKTMRKEHFSLHDREYATLEQAQAAVDAFVEDYNTQRPHQALGMRPPVERFRFARPADVSSEPEPAAPASTAAAPRRVPGVTRWVDRRGSISLARFDYWVGPVFAGRLVEAVVDGGLVQIYHQGVLVATHVQRVRPDDTTGSLRGTRMPVARAASNGMSVRRIADNNGNVSFAGTMYSAGRMWRGQQLDVRIVGASVQISKDDHVIRVHAIRHARRSMAPTPTRTDTAGTSRVPGIRRQPNRTRPVPVESRPQPLRGRPDGRALTRPPPPAPAAAVAECPSQHGQSDTCHTGTGDDVSPGYRDLTQQKGRPRHAKRPPIRSELSREFGPAAVASGKEAASERAALEGRRIDLPYPPMLALRP